MRHLLGGKVLAAPLILACALLGSTAHAACTGSSPTWTATADQNSVSSCISNASSGDTINVSSGSASWSGMTIPSSKGLTLACPSLSCTVTLSGGDGTFAINTGSASTTVTGFTFDGSGANEGSTQINLASGPPYNAAPRFYNNTFNTGGVAVTINGLGPALIDHNTITVSSNAAETFHILGGNAGCTSCWSEDVVPGSANMVFLENNSWAFTAGPSSGYCQAEEANYGAVFVLRDNALNDCQMDAHGAGPSTRWAEIYNNAYTNCCGSGAFIDWRGGSGVYWGNTSGSPSNNPSTNLGPICGSSDACGTYPVQYQFGEGINGTHYTPNYIWGSGTPEQSGTLYNRESSMVQVGTAPNDPNHCSGLSGNLCNAIYSTTQPSTLERCESAADLAAGCPVSYTYQAYAYPHPLDNCSSSHFGAGATCGSTSASTPSPPSSLSGALK